MVVRLQKPPVMFKLVQNGPRPLHSGARSTSSGPTGCLKTNWTLFGAILVSLSTNPTIAPKSVQFLAGTKVVQHVETESETLTECESEESERV